MPAAGYGEWRISLGLTFVEPVAEPVEDDPLLAGGHQTDGATLHCGAIVDVVLENEDLGGKKARMSSCVLVRDVESPPADP